GDIDVKRPGIQQVATPLQFLPVRAEVQSRELLDRTRGTVFAGNPFGVVEGQRSRIGGNGHFGMKNSAGNISRIHFDGDKRRLLLGKAGNGCESSANKEKKTENGLFHYTPWPNKRNECYQSTQSSCTRSQANL